MLATARKKIEADHKKASSAVGEQLDLLKANGASPDVLDRVNELQKLDNSFKDQVGGSFRLNISLPVLFFELNVTE